MAPRCVTAAWPSTVRRRIDRHGRQAAPDADAARCEPDLRTEQAALPRRAALGPAASVQLKQNGASSFSSLAIMTAPTVADLNRMGVDCLPGHLGVAITRADAIEVRAEMAVSRLLMAPNGYLHAGSVVTLADTSCGYACIVNLPQGATGFTTIELKSNFLGTAREGTLDCVATAQHRGRTTQVWDAVVTHRETGKTVALFRCTQMILWPQSA
jgi:1,4-dihydroxy-2-naphthoyl-CoA hydrolase